MRSSKQTAASKRNIKKAINAHVEHSKHNGRDKDNDNR